MTFLQCEISDRLPEDDRRLDEIAAANGICLRNRLHQTIGGKRLDLLTMLMRKTKLSKEIVL